MSSHIIGHVDNVTGTVSASRADGARVALAEGDAVFEGDEVHTGADSAVAIVFIDDTTFSLGANASMALDELIFDPDSQSGSSAFSILEGAFVFVSGKIAEDNPDNMTVGTPVATIGVRGTEVGGKCDESCVIAVIDGKIVISNAGGQVVLTL
ncbi:MAG: FecR family protein, partial [Alphaproteobacteria bacterium]